MSLFNAIDAKVSAFINQVEKTDRAAAAGLFGEVADTLNYGIGSVLGTDVQSNLSELGGGGEFADTVAAIAGNYAGNYGEQFSKYPPAKLGALWCEPLKAVKQVANAACQ
ncbi:hypothetical protein [Methylovulum psychrotolerans]|uniref:Uncharacterized protein n=1 Tax=Methylovulum psychrotolerans TaxID=1704499 RepID=A0A1Z4C4F6_9GAMM|nr:hypothetical protein [Methylovulum psychrotolerans]ASF48390.1 hypothetical protein CEK71_21295 [Methylovulum psychrotolerans]